MKRHALLPKKKTRFEKKWRLLRTPALLGRTMVLMVNKNQLCLQVAAF
jgi:hypothetical protein